MATLAEAERRHALHFAQRLEQLNEAYENRDRDQAITEFDLDWGQIEKGQGWAAQRASIDEQAANIAFLYQAFGANLLVLRRPPAEAISWMKAVLDLVRDAYVRAELLNRLANATQAGGGYAEAEVLYEEAIATLLEPEAASDDQEYVDRQLSGYLRNRAGVQKSLGRFEQAIAGYEQALEATRARGDRAEEGSLLGNLAIVYADRDEDAKAVPLYEQALAIAQETGDEHEQELWLGNLGNSFAALGRSEEAIEHIQQAVTIARRLGDKAEEAARLGALAGAHLASGRADLAAELRKDALAIARAMGSPRIEAIQLHGLGQAWAEIGDQSRAIEYLSQAAALFEQMELHYEAERSRTGVRIIRTEGLRTMLTESEREIAQGRFGVARQILEDGLESSREVGARAAESAFLGNLGFVLHMQNQWEQAIEYFTAALQADQQVQEPALTGRHLGNLGNLYQEIHDFGQARSYYKAALRTLEGTDESELLGMTHANLGTLSLHEGRNLEARNHLQAARNHFVGIGRFDLVAQIDATIRDHLS